MRWLPDQTGRIRRRPHFEPAEIDQECESLVADFLLRRTGQVRYPLSTDDLTVLVEREAADLDLYADLGDTVTEGVTEFIPGQRPRVRIAARLSEDGRREHRLRTTLAHELGHVRLHACLWTLDGGAPAGLMPACRRQDVERLSGADWLEWQAGYACGALLMPAGAVARLVTGSASAVGGRLPLFLGSRQATGLVGRVARQFGVSTQAVRVRLLMLGYLSKRPSRTAVPWLPARPAGRMRPG